MLSSPITATNLVYQWKAGRVLTQMQKHIVQCSATGHSDIVQNEDYGQKRICPSYPLYSDALCT